MLLASNATSKQCKRQARQPANSAACELCSKKAKAQASHASKQVMYASEMQQWNKMPLIGFGVAGNQGSFIIRKRNGAIEQATQTKERNVYRNQSKLAK